MASFLADSGAYDIEPLAISDVTAAYAPHAVKDGVYFSAQRSAGGEVDQYSGLKYTDLYFYVKQWRFSFKANESGRGQW